MDREEVELDALRETILRGAKHKLDRACDGGGWLAVFTSLQYGTDLSIEEFRDYFRWCLSLPLLNPPPPPHHM